MKKIDYILSGLLMCASVNAFSSCGNKSQTTEVAESVSVDTLTVETKTDSMQNENASVFVSMSLPVGDSEVAKTIRKNLVTLMGTQIYKDADFFEDGTMHGAPFKGNTEDTKAICSFYCNNIFKVISKVAADDIAEGMLEIDPNETDIDQRYCQEMNLVKVSEADNYIVFDDVSYSFFGGGKGGTFYDHYIVFNRTTGEQVKSIIKPGSVAKMQRILLDGMKCYFKAMEDPDDNHIDTDQAVLDLFHEDLVPLPKGNTIMPTKDGLAICYMENDMGSSTFGQPGFTVAYDDVKEFMTPEALELVKGLK